MRRCFAPSQLAKRRCVQEDENGVSVRNAKETHSNGDSCENGERVVLSKHEAFIRSLLCKPYKVPIPNYVPSLQSRSLGLKRTSGPRPLHDPDEEGALWSSTAASWPTRWDSERRCSASPYLWTLLRQSPEFATPTITKAIIVTPSSLVKNWHNELSKWLGDRVRSVAIESGSKAEIDSEVC
ncbi:hypothetical protein MRX96_017708 [Rhipicephalus microplus]